MDATHFNSPLATRRSSFSQNGITSMAVVNVSLTDNGDQHHISKFLSNSTRGIASLGWLLSRYSSSGYSQVHHVVLMCPQPVYGRNSGIPTTLPINNAFLDPWNIELPYIKKRVSEWV